jgi:hypothetical protein
VSTLILRSDSDAATAVFSYTTACSPNKIAFPGAVATEDTPTNSIVGADRVIIMGEISPQLCYEVTVLDIYT